MIYNLNNYYDLKHFDENLVIGYFDTFHAGHYRLLTGLKNFSVLLITATPTKDIDVHTVEQRAQILMSNGARNIYLFDAEANNVTAAHFVESVLKRMGPKNIVVGKGFSFGQNAAGDVALLKRNFKVTEIPRFGGISSTKIKKLLAKGKFNKATDLLSAKILIAGKVEKGDAIARTLGFPTANIHREGLFPLPEGVYASTINCNGLTYDSITYIRDTKCGQLVETNVVEKGFNKVLYGTNVSVELDYLLRGKKHFKTKEQLIKAIKQDIINANSYR